MPKNIEIIQSDENLIGMINSTEVRRRIREVKQEARNQLENELNTQSSHNDEESKQSEESISKNQAILSAKYFYSIGGLVTKSTIEFIRNNNLY